MARKMVKKTQKLKKSRNYKLVGGSSEYHVSDIKNPRDLHYMSKVVTSYLETPQKIKEAKESYARELRISPEALTDHEVQIMNYYDFILSHPDFGKIDIPRNYIYVQLLEKREEREAPERKKRELIEAELAKKREEIIQKVQEESTIALNSSSSRLNELEIQRIELTESLNKYLNEINQLRNSGDLGDKIKMKRLTELIKSRDGKKKELEDLYANLREIREESKISQEEHDKEQERILTTIFNTYGKNILEISPDLIKSYMQKVKESSTPLKLTKIKLNTLRERLQQLKSRVNFKKSSSNYSNDNRKHSKSLYNEKQRVEKEYNILKQQYSRDHEMALKNMLNMSNNHEKLRAKLGMSKEVFDGILPMTPKEMNSLLSKRTQLHQPPEKMNSLLSTRTQLPQPQKLGELRVVRTPDRKPEKKWFTRKGKY
jgi:hypothetical protein